jgi:Flp pilus assembly protein TadG
MLIRPKTKRQGTAAAEFIMVLPLLAAFLLGTIEFSMLLHARQQLLAAAREGARVGARGGNDAEIQAQVNAVLGYSATAFVTRFSAAPPNTRDGLEVRVVVQTTDLVPNLLPLIYNLNGQQLVGRAVMNLE